MRWLWSLMLLTLAGCATMPPPTEKTPAAASSQAMIMDAPIVKPAPRTSDAVLSLLVDARTATRDGQLDVAAAHLERAVRMDPRNPLVWNYLARVRLYQGRYDLASSLAAKSNSLASGDQKLMADNQEIIRQAQQAH